MRREVAEQHMRRCLELAARAAGRAAPNPMVGCVILDPRGRVIAEGWHRAPGRPHAEAEALAVLRRRGMSARGCTVVTNLEPCHHKRNRRTAPCSLALADAGIARLVMGIGDPARSHAGGARYLRGLGVEVLRGVLRRECAELNRDFATWARTRRPYVVLKAAMTLDGRIATRTGESQWITGEQARAHGHALRARWQAIAIGAGTAVADDPRLTVRGRGRASGRSGASALDPIRVVVDSRLRTPPTARVWPANSDSEARVIAACTDRAPRSRAVRLADTGAEVWRLPADARGRVDVAALLDRLGREHITSLLVEGGGELHASFLEPELADELCVYVAPMVFGGGARGSRGRGGAIAPAWVGGDGVARIADAPRFAYAGPAERVGADLAVTLRRARGRRRKR